MGICPSSSDPFSFDSFSQSVAVGTSDRVHIGDTASLRTRMVKRDRLIQTFATGGTACMTADSAAYVLNTSHGDREN